MDSLFQRGSRALLSEGRSLAAALGDWRLATVLGIFAVLLLLAAQAPLNYRFDVGQEEGYGSDLPLVADFHAAEQLDSAASTRGPTYHHRFDATPPSRKGPQTIGLFQPQGTSPVTFRWTTRRSRIRLPGVGQRALLLRIRLLPVNAEVAQHGPRAIELWANGGRLGQLVVRPATGGSYGILVPPPADRSGDQEIELRSSTFTPAGDQRAIGTLVDAVHVSSASWPALPPWRSSLAWLGAALVLWLALRRAGLTRDVTLAGLLATVLLASLAALLDPPRFAFGSGAALIVAALGWLLVLLLAAVPDGLTMAGLALLPPALTLRALVGVDAYAGWGGPAAVALGGVAALLLAGWLRPAIGALYARVAPPIPRAARRWLLLFALIVFMTHFGGKLYPDSMWGDIGFHAHRFMEVVQGKVLLISSNRGVDFPYPPAFYLLLAPIALTGIDERVLLRLVSALLDALSPFLVYSITACSLRQTTSGQISAREWHTGVLAAGIYAFTAATLMTTWWNFSSHIFTQFAHLLLITTLVLLPIADLQADGDHRPSTIKKRQWLIGVFVLQLCVYLGHFGFWMNMSLLGGFSLAALLLGALRGRVAWGVVRCFLLGFVAAEGFAVLCFYSAYAGMFIAQAQATAAGGLTELADRQAVDRAILWRTLWDAGFRTHFALFPIPLALCSLALLWPRRVNSARQQPARVGPGRTMLGTASSPVIALMAGTFVIGLLFAALPFLTGSTLATRWLMFSAWAIAVGAARAAQRLWRSRRAGRWMVVAMSIYVVWGTASMWLTAMAWRVRPPEPF